MPSGIFFARYRQTCGQQFAIAGLFYVFSVRPAIKIAFLTTKDSIVRGIYQQYLEEMVKEILCRKLHMATFDETKVKDTLDVVMIQSDGTLSIGENDYGYLEMMMK